MAQHRTAEIPEWVQADPACLRAWRSNKCWRRAARGAVPPGAAEAEGGTTLGDTLLAAAQWWAARERKRAEAEGTGPPPQQPLAPHAGRCLCWSCEEKRAALLKKATTRREGRGRAFWAGHSCPEHREGWRISPERLSDFLKTHQDLRDRRGRLTHLEMRTRWVNHLDALLVEQCLAHLRACRPYWAWLIARLVVDEEGQERVAEQLGLSQATVSRHLKDAVRYVADWLAGARPEQEEGRRAG